MGRGAAAGALLVALVVLGAPPAAGAELSGVFQEMRTRECHFINGTEKVRFVRRYIYNRKQYMMFDSDVGVFVGDTPYGETQARCCNGIPEILEDNRAAVDTFCRAGYELAAPFLTGHRGERGAERVPSGPALPMTLERLKTSLRISPEPSALLRNNPGASCPTQCPPWLSQSVPVHPCACPACPSRLSV
ncbi:H-2 class II histocompatibility antigen, I-E beta chain-like [Zonotrichia leucophrys gambelii]|uniref:H-2 class II histocompatibility antigen, I-E beta chain-like n=1 Tax=Zonotrichia leucophrys gambelii TaxID=257770 RepID=UPI003140BE35